MNERRWNLLEGDAYDWSVQKPGLLPQRGEHVVEILNNLEAECARYKAIVEERHLTGTVLVHMPPGRTCQGYAVEEWDGQQMLVMFTTAQALEPTAEKA